MSGIRKIDSLVSLFSILLSKIGSPVSINNLAMDIGTSFNTISDWLTVFDRFFLSFSLSPWTSKIVRAIKKEKKIFKKKKKKKKLKKNVPSKNNNNQEKSDKQGCFFFF